MEIIGICGISASGKTSLARLLSERYQNITVLAEDNFYKPKEEQQKDENGKFNFDLPTSLRNADFLETIHTLQSGLPAEISEYNFNLEGIKPKNLIVQPTPILVIEGQFIFTNRSIAEQCSLKIGLDGNLGIFRERRVKRDLNERGYLLEDIHYQWEHHVLQAYNRHIRPSLELADHQLSADLDLDTLMESLEQLLKENFQKDLI